MAHGPLGAAREAGRAGWCVGHALQSGRVEPTGRPRSRRRWRGDGLWRRPGRDSAGARERPAVRPAPAIFAFRCTAESRSPGAYSAVRAGKRGPSRSRGALARANYENEDGRLPDEPTAPLVLYGTSWSNASSAKTFLGLEGPRSERRCGSRRLGAGHPARDGRAAPGPVAALGAGWLGPQPGRGGPLRGRVVALAGTAGPGRVSSVWSPSEPVMVRARTMATAGSLGASAVTGG
jgi:hypothetical protein